MTKAELIDTVHDSKFDMNKREVEQMVDVIFDALKGAITSDGRFSYPGFGTFTVRTRAARTGHNPRTGDPIQIPESKVVAFKPAPTFKKIL